MRKAKIKPVKNHGQRTYKIESIGVDGNRRRRFFQDKNPVLDRPHNEYDRLIRN